MTATTEARVQNALLLTLSYGLYGWLSPWALLILLVATVLFFVLGRYSAPLVVSLLSALGVGLLAWRAFLPSGAMLLGVSFFTFRLMAYPIEVYRGRMGPCRDFVAFALYVAFFPTLLSGPIDRPGPFLAQLAVPRRFDSALVMRGLKHIVWGAFLKLCVANHIATYQSMVLHDPGNFRGLPTLLVGLLAPVRLYGDFFGYTCLATGAAALLGIRVAENFRRPFFARDVAEYWRRWHVSLTSWLTDYVFMPLCVSLRSWGKAGVAVAVMVNMLLVGVWHGAGLTYALFGLYHGLLMLPLVLGWRVPRSVVGTYLLVAFGQMIFFSPSLSILGQWIATACLPTSRAACFVHVTELAHCFYALPILFAYEYMPEAIKSGYDPLRFAMRRSHRPTLRYAKSGGMRTFRGVWWILLCIFIMLFGEFDGSNFVYIQF